MFTGLVEEAGSLLWIRAIERGTELEIAVPNIDMGRIWRCLSLPKFALPSKLCRQ